MPLPQRSAGTLGQPLDSRERLFKEAGFTEAEQTALARKTIARVDEQLDATHIQHFAHEGQVTDQRTTVANEARLKAIDASYRLLGLAAPRSEQKVTVTYKLELPSWSQPDTVQVPQVVEIEGKVE